jgi:hypothetical protein
VAANGSARLLFRTGNTATLVGPGDRARWRADGSPSLTEGAGQVREVDYAIGRFVGGNLQATHLTYRDLLALPTEEAALSERLGTIVPPAVGVSLERAKVEAVAELLGANPAPPILRAALYDVVSKLPGLELEGARVDPFGRRGVGLAVADASAKTILVVDPASARVLGLETVILRRLPYVDARPGTVISEHWYLESRVVPGFRGHLVPRPCGAAADGLACWIRSR